MTNETNREDVLLFNTFKYWTLLWLSCASLLGSILIIFITVIGKPIKSDFRYFIANLCFVDVLSSAIWVIVLILSKTVDCATSFICILFVLLLYANILGMVTALLPTVVSRYVLFCQSRDVYDRWFSKRMILLYLFLADAYPIVCIGALFILKKNGSKTGVTVFTMSFLIMFVVSYILIAFCSISVYRKVKTHFSRQHRRQSHRSRSFSEHNHEVVERDVVKATLYQAIIPLIAQLPQFISVVDALFVTRVPPPIDYWGYFVALFMVIGPLADVLLTFSVIRAYRCAVENLFNHVRTFFNKPPTITPWSG